MDFTLTSKDSKSFLYALGGYLMACGMETWESEYESMTIRKHEYWYPNGGVVEV